MKLGKISAAIALFALVAPSRQQARAEEALTAIVGATVVHPERPGAPSDKDTTIIISGDRIQSVGPARSTPVPRGATVIGAKGKWVIPGLIDSHVHFFQSADPYTRPDAIDATKVVPYAKEVERNKARLPATFKVWLASGVTSVADVGGPFWNFEMRDAARRTAAAPRVAVAGPLISMVDRPALDLGDPPIIKITSPEAARELCRRMLEKKPDFIKVWFIWRPGDDLAAQEQIVKAAGDAAHGAGIRLAVHATELDVAKAALRAGADVLVHSVTDKPVDEEFLNLVKRNKAIYIPTLFVLDGYTLVRYNSWRPTEPERRLADPQILEHMNDLEHARRELLPASMIPIIRQIISFRPGVKNVSMENLKKVFDAGIPVAMGTDAGNIGTLHGPSIFREMALMVESGLTLPEVLASATVIGARTMGLEKDLGTLEQGKLADLVILNADPLGKVDNLSHAHRVLKGGKIYDPVQLMQSIR